MLTALLINVVLVGLFTAGLSLSSAFLGPRRTLPGDKGMPYETGMPPLEPRARAMWVSYYRFAVLFVIFDADLAFLAPWILLRHRLTLEAAAAVSVFAGLVALTLAYVWRKGELRC